MKKIFTLFSLTLLAANVALGQGNSIEIINSTTLASLNGQSVTVNAESYSGDVHFDQVKVVNKIGTTKINCKRYEIANVSNTQNYFCWYVCLSAVSAGVNLLTHPTGPVTNTSLNDTITGFSGHHVTNGQVGVSTYRYVFYDVSNPNDSAYFDLTFDVALSTPELEQVSLNVFPNPANDQITIESNGTDVASVEILDALGRSVYSQSNHLTSKLVVNTSDFQNGVYFIRILNNNNNNREAIKTRKLLINH